MAKYTPIEMVKNYQGKICSHSDTYFQRRGKDKSVLCTGKMCNPRKAAAVKALTSEQKAAYKAEWLQQDKYQFLSAFIMHKEFEKLV